MAVRDIRFRAWNGEKMVQIGLMGLHTENNSNPSIYIDMPDTDQVPKYSDCPVMQFTGLIDKAGVEIYENDIVYLIEQGVIATVEWIPTSFLLMPREDASLDEQDKVIEAQEDFHYTSGVNLKTGRLQSFKVIGNMYQDKDLL